MRNKVAKAIAMSDVKAIFVSLVDKAANQRQFLITKAEDGRAIFQTYGRILKADSEAHYVTGIVYEPMVEDTQGNYMTAEEIEKAQRWFAKNANNVDLQHNFEKMESASVVENWIAKCDCQINGQDVKEGTWLMTVEVTDPGIFDAIEKGEITGFSMGGSGVYATEDDDISGEGNSVQKSGLNIFQKMAKAFTTPKPVKKGAVMDTYKRTSIHDNFWNAYYALSDYLLDSYNPETGKWEIQHDEEVIRAALEDFNQIVTQLLTGDQPVVKALNAATVEKAAGTGNENLNVLKSIYQNLGTFIEKSEEQEEMEVEITKAELETIVAGAVQKAMGASQNAANPPQNAEGAAITTTVICGHSSFYWIVSRWADENGFERKRNFMIQISNLSKKYGETVVFSDLNYTFENACIYGLVGRNGAGKTTLLNILSNYEKNYASQLLECSCCYSRCSVIG